MTHFWSKHVQTKVSAILSRPRGGPKVRFAQAFLTQRETERHLGDPLGAARDHHRQKKTPGKQSPAPTSMGYHARSSLQSCQHLRGPPFSRQCFMCCHKITIFQGPGKPRVNSIALGIVRYWNNQFPRILRHLGHWFRCMDVRKK